MAENVLVLPVTHIERETSFEPPDLLKRLQWSQSDHIDDEKPIMAALLGEAIDAVKLSEERRVALVGHETDIADLRHRLATAAWTWLPIEHRPLKTGRYIVAHRGHEEILHFFGPDKHWAHGTIMGWRRLGKKGWERDDPVERFHATHCILIQAPPD